MSGILYLTADDFVVRKGEKGNLLCLNYDARGYGLSLVLFYSNECQHCNRLLVQYKQLPYNINGCQFTMINVNRVENRRVVSMSNQTIVPITYVPDIILYVNGLPYMRYDGNHDIHSIKAFILDIHQQLQKTASMNPFMDSGTNRSSVPPQQRQAPSSSPRMPQQQHQREAPNRHPADAPLSSSTTNSSIPAYTIGRPKCSGPREDVSYVSFSEAYHGASSSNPPSSGEPPQPVFYAQRQ